MKNIDILIEQFTLFNNDHPCPQSILHNNIMVYDDLNNINFEIKENTENTCNSRIIWVYNENNYRIPYNENGDVIQYYILQPTDNIYNYISSTTIIDDDNIICGEKIQNIADVVMGMNSSLNYNPHNKYFSKAMISIENMDAIDISKYKSIFVFTHDLERFYEKYKGHLYGKIIISHNSDGEINYIHNDVLLHMGQNCLIKSEKENHQLIAIPIGIENFQWFPHEIFHKVRKMKIQKSKDVYFYFNLNTHFTRKICYDTLKGILTWNSKKSKEEYFIELAQHKYCICPRGNGLDTHRLWECLYLDVIPIVIRDDFPNTENLPIIIIDKWEDITNDFLLSLSPIKCKDQQIEKLTIQYYNNFLCLNK